MKIRLILVQLCCAASLSAQISISKTEMPGTNDTLRHSTTLPLINVDSTGPGSTWDFSNLQPLAQDLSNYKLGALTPYFLYFPTMVGTKISDSLGAGPLVFKNIYNFYKSSNTKFTAEGTGFQYTGFPFASDYSDPDEIYQFPLTFPDRDSSTFRVETVLPLVGSFIQRGTRINEVDGWGSITTPYGTFDCIRVKSTIDEIDSIVSSIITIGIPVSRIEYKWLAKGERIPILQIDGQDLFGQFVPNAARYRDIYRAEAYKNLTRFVANKTKVTTTDTVRFTDQSFLSTGWQWSFTPSNVTYLNGTNASSKNPQVRFNGPGLYSVKLIANYSGGVDDTLAVNYIEAGIGPVALFSASNTKPAVGDEVLFTDASTSAFSWKWTFTPLNIVYNSGYSMMSQSPKVRFTKPGAYTVCLQATNAFGSNTSCKTDYIQIAGTGLPELQIRQINVYPNPASGKLFVGLLENSICLEACLFDITGKKIELRPVKENDFEISVQVPEMLEGIYLLQVTTIEGRFISRVQLY